MMARGGLLIIFLRELRNTQSELPFRSFADTYYVILVAPTLSMQAPQTPTVTFCFSRNQA